MGKGNHGQKRIQMHQKMDMFPNKGQQKQLQIKAMLAMKQHGHKWIYALLLVLGLTSMVYFASGVDYPTGSIVIDHPSQKYAWPEMKQKETSCTGQIQQLQEQIIVLQRDISALRKEMKEAHP